jgi:hypothetical protein
VDDLPDALLSDAKHLSQCGYGLTFFVSCANFSIARAFGGSASANATVNSTWGE